MTVINPVVLIVEDEPLILIHSRLALEDAGFDVIVAGDSDEALAVIGRRPDVTTLFTDVNIPGALDGLALAEAARRHHPAMAIFVTSGIYRPESGALPAGAHFLPKPYTGAQVLRLMRADAGTEDGADGHAVNTYAARH
ncbi:response regulator [Sphingomonas sp. CROZ-RG-20F-R02-07]|uniref:response regulator n=1 Tax=Sphingomonas sp. CROZ-RG-20F-R02-07 TaxID=2914832 RepID=UPI001F560AEB|nr:response regulator [Sphingomonas sp. CROZ-RG-20F-R02-07]